MHTAPELVEQLHKLYSGVPIDGPLSLLSVASGADGPAPGASASTSAPVPTATSPPTATTTSPTTASSPAASTLDTSTPSQSASQDEPAPSPPPPTRPKSPDWEAQRLANVARNALIMKQINKGATYEEIKDMDLEALAAESPPEKPEWMEGAQKYFEEVSDATWWVAVVRVWVEFERILGYPEGQVRYCTSSHHCRASHQSTSILGPKELD